MFGAQSGVFICVGLALHFFSLCMGCLVSRPDTFFNILIRVFVTGVGPYYLSSFLQIGILSPYTRGFIFFWDVFLRPWEICVTLCAVLVIVNMASQMGKKGAGKAKFVMGSLGPGRAPVGSPPWILDGLGSGNERQGPSV